MICLRLVFASILILLPTFAYAEQWGVHLASFKQKANVHTGWLELQADYPTLLAGLSEQHMVADIPGKGRFIRLLAGPISNKNDAEALRQQFVARGKYADVMALPPASAPQLVRSIPSKSPSRRMAGTKNLRVQIRPVDTHDLIDMDANPVDVMVPESKEGQWRKTIAQDARRAEALRERRMANQTRDNLPEPASVSFHSDTLTKNNNTGAVPKLAPGGEREAHEFAGVAIGNDDVSLTPGLCHVDDEVAPYAGIGVSF